MLRDSLIYKFLFISLVCLLPCTATEPKYEDLRKFMLNADVESIIKEVENSKSIDLDKKKIKLGEENAVLYGQSLVVVGDVVKSRKYVEIAIKKYPKNTELKEIKKHLDFFFKNYSGKQISINDEEKIHIKLMREFPKYISKLNQHKASRKITSTTIKTKKLSPQLKREREKLKELIEKVSNNEPYFPGKLDYLIELQDPKANKQAEQEALEIIENKQRILFPKTMDFYELAVAYKTLGILSAQENKIKDATKFIEMGKHNIFKMRAIWLEEDLVIERPILKIDYKKTKFGFLVPQWLILLREEFNSYLT